MKYALPHSIFQEFSFSFFLSGEIFELKAELNSDKKEKKKEAVKKVIASMTVGKDVRQVYNHVKAESHLDSPTSN
jgi:vesicle coat complex subunit